MNHPKVSVILNGVKLDIPEDLVALFQSYDHQQKSFELLKDILLSNPFGEELESELRDIFEIQKQILIRLHRSIYWGCNSFTRLESFKKPYEHD